LAFAGEQESTRLLAPNDERAAGVWPERQGDRQVAEDIAAALGSGVTARRSPLFFDGGDFVADAETVFVTPSVLFRNLQLTVYSSDELRDVLHTRTGRQVVLLETAPDHHAGMFMMPVGERTVLVGDPSAAWEILDRGQAGAVPRPDLLPEGIHPDRSPETQRRFDAVADQCQAQGYRVVRMPLVPGDDGRTWLSYLNVILDERSGQRTVSLPVFDGAEELNKAAIAAWEELGFLVRPVNCTACAAHFGTLRCLVNVLRRS
jgi:hypothetical protein